MRLSSRLGVALWLACGFTAGALAAGPAPVAAAPTRTATPAAATHPTWAELTPQQREALAPLSADWDRFGDVRKKKWLEVAKNYHHLSPEGQQHVHERMGELARMTPEQRRTTRENFRRAYELPMDQRQALVQQYGELPPERKRQLADQAAKPVAAPRKPTRDAKLPPAPVGAASIGSAPGAAGAPPHQP